jgi:hypothetical protein
MIWERFEPPEFREKIAEEHEKAKKGRKIPGSVIED